MLNAVKPNQTKSVADPNLFYAPIFRRSSTAGRDLVATFIIRTIALNLFKLSTNVFDHNDPAKFDYQRNHLDRKSVV